MAHLNFKMKETTAAQQPLDERILKYLLVKPHPSRLSSHHVAWCSGASTLPLKLSGA